MGEVAGPAGDLAPAGVAGGRVVGGHDAGGRRRQAAIALIVAPAQAAGSVPVVVLGQDLPQGLHLGAAQQARKTGCQVLQQQPGVRPGVVHPGLRPGGVLAQADWPAVAAAPLVINQAFQRITGGAGDLFQGRPHRLGDQLQAGQVPHRRQDVGGVGALGGALADQPGLLQPGQGQVKEPVRSPVLQQALAEVTEHAVMEARIVEIEAERVLKVDPAPHGLSGTAVREIEQELQHAHRGQLRRRESRTPVPGIPSGEVLVLPQAIEPVPHPHRRRPGRVAGPRYPRGQLRDLDPQAGTDRHHALLRDLAGLTYPRKTGPPTWPQTGQTPRSPTESSLELLSESADSGEKPPR